MNIFIGNLNFQTTEEQLQDVFAPFGEVTSVKIVTDKFTGRSRGFAFVEMPDQTEAEKAVEELHDYVLNNRNMVVNEAKPKTEDNRLITGHDINLLINNCLHNGINRVILITGLPVL